LVFDSANQAQQRLPIPGFFNFIGLDIDIYHVVSAAWLLVRRGGIEENNFFITLGETAILPEC